MQLNNTFQSLIVQLLHFFMSVSLQTPNNSRTRCVQKCITFSFNILGEKSVVHIYFDCCNIIKVHLQACQVLEGLFCESGGGEEGNQWCRKSAGKTYLYPL